MPKHGVEISVFDGGLNTKSIEFNLALNQSPKMFGFVFDDYGALKVSNGIKTHNSTLIATFPIDGLYSFKPSTMSALLLAVCGGNAYVLTGTATTPVLIGSSTSLLTQNIPCEIIATQELAFFSNGIQQPYKFNGNEFTRAGISAPAQALSAFSNAAGGNLTGAYTYVYAGVNSYSAEGDYAGTAPSITVTTAQVRVTNIPTAPASHGINSWNVYRNTANAAGIYWKVTAVTNGVTSFTDNVADSGLVTAASTDQGYLRKFKFMVPYAGRLWGTVEDLLWYSEINQPEEFPSTNFIRVGRGDGMNISAIASFKGMVVVSKSDYNGKTAVYQLLIGDSVSFSDPENWYLNKLSDYGGAESQRACIPYSTYLMLFNRNGAFAFDGTGPSAVAAETGSGKFLADTISQNIEDDLKPSSLANQGLLRGAAAVNWKNKVWLSIDKARRGGSSIGLTQVVNSDIYIFDYTRISNSDRKGGAWSYLMDTDDLSARQFVSQFAIHEGRLFGGDSGYLDLTNQTGYIYELDISDPGASSGSVNWKGIYYTAHIHGDKGHESLWKDFRYVFITCSGQGTLNVYYKVDGEAATASSLGFTGNSAITLTSAVTRHKINLVAAANGKRIIFAFNMELNSTGDALTVSKLEVYYNIRGTRNA